VTRERAGRAGVRIRHMRFFSSPKRPYRLWGPTSLLFNGCRGSFSGQSGLAVTVTPRLRLAQRY
jgi:hypothetical protein